MNRIDRQTSVRLSADESNRRFLVSALGQVVFELVLERLHVGLERIVRFLQAEHGVVGDSRLDRRRPSARSTVVLTQYALGYVCSANGMQSRMLCTLETHSCVAWSISVVQQVYSMLYALYC